MCLKGHRCWPWSFHKLSSFTSLADIGSGFSGCSSFIDFHCLVLPVLPLYLRERFLWISLAIWWNHQVTWSACSWTKLETSSSERKAWLPVEKPPVVSTSIGKIHQRDADDNPVPFNKFNLVGGLEHFLCFHLEWLGRIIPTWLICFRGFETTRVCLKIVYPIVPNGFADHYPVFKNG